MKAKVASTAGFCMGVRRAMELVLKEASEGEGLLYTFGELIHNTQVLEFLKSKGVRPVNDLRNIEEGRIVIRAHGIPPERLEEIKNKGLSVLDATCPRVRRVQSIIRYHTSKGYEAVIVGDRDHPEVIGLVGYAKAPVHVVSSAEEIDGLAPSERLFMVAQTTQEPQKFFEVADALQERFPDTLVFNTICEATHQRQKEVASFAGEVDAVIVVGGYQSGNTRRLVHVSRMAGLPTFHVETEKDLNKERLSEAEVVGVTAGASTPNWIIKNVVKEIEGICRPRRSPVYRLTNGILKFLILSHLFAASGAFCFSYAVEVLMEVEPVLRYPVLTFLYIFAMHILNRFVDRTASAYTDPDRSMFHRKFRPLLIGLALVSVGSALALGYTISVPTFLALGGLTFLGIMYSLPVIPFSVGKHLRGPYRIKDIPGSKPLSEALGSMMVMVALPLLEFTYVHWLSALSIALMVFMIVYARSALLDISRFSADLISGTETMSKSLGKERTLLLVKSALLLCSLLIIGSYTKGFISSFSLLFLLPVFALGLCLLAYRRRWRHPGLGFEAMVEASFFLAGFLGLIWQSKVWHW